MYINVLLLFAQFNCGGVVRGNPNCAIVKGSKDYIFQVLGWGYFFDIFLFTILF